MIFGRQILDHVEQLTAELTNRLR